MNRDYSYVGPVPSPSFVHVPDRTPDAVDYLMPLCSMCFQTGDLVVAQCDGFLTYAHPGCSGQRVDKESPIR